MKVKHSIALVSMLLLMISTAVAAPVVVEFVDGSVQILVGSAWKELDFGDTFDSSQSVKLGARSVLELRSQAGSTVAIAAPGTYLVDSLFKPRTEASALASVASKLDTIAKGGQRDITVAGVRGSEAVLDTGTMWAGDTIEADEAMKSGDAATRNNDNSGAYTFYMEAFELYMDAYDPTGAAMAAYRASLSALASGSGARALAALRSASPTDAGSIRGSYALALATLSARYGANDEAKALLTTGIDAGWFEDPTSLSDAKSLLNAL